MILELQVILLRNGKMRNRTTKYLNCDASDAMKLYDKVSSLVDSSPASIKTIKKVQVIDGSKDTAIFLYRCKKCKHEWEVTISPGFMPDGQCPKCESWGGIVLKISKVEN